MEKKNNDQTDTQTSLNFSNDKPENLNKNNFEKDFERLEKMLEEMNEGQLSLDRSLKLFEEANGLINNCHEKLQSAEQKIEKLLKNRQNNILVDENQTPVKEEFEPETNPFAN